MSVNITSRHFDKSIMKVIGIMFVLLLCSKTGLTQGNISGNLVYANAALSSIHDSTMVQLYQDNNLITEVPVDSDGNFTFNSVTEGNYSVKALVSKIPGGWNTMDSYLVLRHYVGLNPLSGIYAVAADVNGSGGTASSSDAHFILLRFTHKITTFYYPQNPNTMLDWVSQNINLTVTPDNTQHITVKVLCTGDVDGSFIPY